MKSFITLTTLMLTAGLFFTGCCNCPFNKNSQTSTGVIQAPPAPPAADQEMTTLSVDDILNDEKKKITTTTP